MAPSASQLSEIKITDIDFPIVEAEVCPHKTLKYLELLEEEGYQLYPELYACCKKKLGELNRKMYLKKFPAVASWAEEKMVSEEVLKWEDEIRMKDKEILSKANSKSVGSSSDSSSVNNHHYSGGLKVDLPPVRGSEDKDSQNIKGLSSNDNPPDAVQNHIQPRENVHNTKEPGVLVPDNAANNKVQDSKLVRDGTGMKDYYRSWEKIDVDKLEKEIDEEESKKAKQKREKEASKKGGGAEDGSDSTRTFQSALTLTQGEEEALKAKAEGMNVETRVRLAQTEKEKGSEAYYAGELEESELYYSRSLIYKPDACSVLTNRALVRLKLGKASLSKRDCDLALKVLHIQAQGDETTVNVSKIKALHRRGKANYELGDYSRAVDDFQNALKLQPNSSQINGDLREARRKLECESRKKGKVSITEGSSDEEECQIEEIEAEENPNSNKSKGKKDDSEDIKPKAAAKQVFKRIAVVEESDSESDSDKEENSKTETSTSTTAAAAATTFSPPKRAPKKPLKPLDVRGLPLLPHEGEILSLIADGERLQFDEDEHLHALDAYAHALREANRTIKFEEPVSVKYTIENSILFLEVQLRRAECFYALQEKRSIPEASRAIKQGLAKEAEFVKLVKRGRYGSADSSTSPAEIFRVRSAFAGAYGFLAHLTAGSEVTSASKSANSGPGGKTLSQEAAKKAYDYIAVSRSWREGTETEANKASNMDAKRSSILFHSREKESLRPLEKSVMEVLKIKVLKGGDTNSTGEGSEEIWKEIPIEEGGESDSDSEGDSEFEEGGSEGVAGASTVTNTTVAGASSTVPKPSTSNSTSKSSSMTTSASNTAPAVPKPVFKKLNIVEEDSDSESEEDEVESEVVEATEAKEEEPNESQESPEFKRLAVTEDDSSDSEEDEEDEEDEDEEEEGEDGKSDEPVVVEAPAEENVSGEEGSEDVYVKVDDGLKCPAGMRRLPVALSPSARSSARTGDLDTKNTQQSQSNSLSSSNKDPYKDPYPSLLVEPTWEGIEIAKKTGNSLFKAGKYEDAAKVFFKCVYCIETTPRLMQELSKGGEDCSKVKQRAMMYSNASFALLKLEDWAGAEAAADQCLAFDKTNTKAIYRRGQARFHLKKFDAALTDMLQVEAKTADADGLQKWIQDINEGIDREKKEKKEKEEKAKKEEKASSSEYKKLSIQEEDSDSSDGESEEEGAQVQEKPTEVIKQSQSSSESSKKPSPVKEFVREKASVNEPLPKASPMKGVQASTKPTPKAPEPIKKTCAPSEAVSTSTTATEKTANKDTDSSAMAQFDDLKLQANQCFAKQLLDEASERYEACLELAKETDSIPRDKAAIICTNLAVTYYKMGKYSNCEKAANQSLVWNPIDSAASLSVTNNKALESARKALFKRSQARMQLATDLPEALQDLNKLVLLFHTKTDFLDEAEKLKKEILHKMKELKREKDAQEMNNSSGSNSNSSSSNLNSKSSNTIGGSSTNSSSGLNLTSNSLSQKASSSGTNKSKYSVPKTAYEFHRVFQSCLRSQPISETYNYLRQCVHPGRTMQAIFKKSSIETEDLGRVIEALATCGYASTAEDLETSEDAEEYSGLKYLTALAKSHNGDMQFMMLEEKERSQVEKILEGAEEGKEKEEFKKFFG